MSRKKPEERPQSIRGRFPSVSSPGYLEHSNSTLHIRIAIKRLQLQTCLCSSHADVHFAGLCAYPSGLKLSRGANVSRQHCKPGPMASSEP